MWIQGEKCDHKCYDDKGMCQRAEWCDKTRAGEFTATILAGLFLTTIMIILAPGAIALKLMDWIYSKMH